VSLSSTAPTQYRHPTTIAQLEIYALCAFAFVLPQFEVPKNVLWLVYAALWLVNRSQTRNFGGKWDAWDSLIFVWVGSGFVSAFYGGLHGSEWVSTLDVLRYGSVLWLVRRSGYGEAPFRQLLVWLVLGTLAGLLRGYYELLFVPRPDGQPRNLGLNSVGHVNHSAIYLTIVFGAAMTWIVSSWRSEIVRRRVLGAALCTSLILSIFVMASRATVGVAIVVGFVILVSFAQRSGRAIWRVILGTFIFVAAVLIIRPEVVEKNQLRIKENNLFAHRDDIWRAGMQALREYPAFGVGMGNYGKIDYPHLEQWSNARGEALDRARLLPQSHAHSLYVNTLVERGLVGFAAVISVLVAWGWSLWRNLPMGDDTPIRWTYWGGALTAWLVAILVGAVNTTLHHEHALISMLLLGGWLCISGAPPQTTSKHA
jgi:O-antigen ligase